MKFLRTFTILIAIILGLGLVVGNVLHSDLRSMMEKRNTPITADEENLKQFAIKSNPDYIMEIYPQKSTYKPYEKITVFAKIVKKSDRSVPKNAVITVQFLKNNIPLNNIRETDTIRLVYNPVQKIWAGNWFPNNNWSYGNIVVSARGYIDSPEAPLQAVNQIFIEETKPQFSIPKGICLLGIESKQRISKRKILGPDGQDANWNMIPVWVRLLSADGILMLGGVTETFNEAFSLENPWEREKINETLTLADMVNQNGGSFGTWIKALEVEGSYMENVGYEPSRYIQGNKPQKNSSFISLRDPNRQKHIVRLFNQYMNHNSIAFVGLSHLFTPANQDVELFESFIRDFQVEVPENWNNMTYDYKFEYFAEKMKNPDFARQFTQWKNFVFADYIRGIIQEAGHQKPVFYYLTQSELEQNPQVLKILFSSGVDFVVLNLSVKYSSVLEKLQELRQNSGMEQFLDQIILSYEVNYENVNIQQYEISAIENFVNANLTVAKSGSSKKNVKGLLINDMYKAWLEKRGPYSPYDWMMGVGKTVYHFKNMNREIPLRVDKFIPTTVQSGKPFGAYFRLVNTSLKNVDNVSIKFLPVLNAADPQKFDKNIGNLSPGSETQVQIPLQYFEKKSQLVRKRYFVGIRITWDDGREGFMDFISINVDKDSNPTNQNP